MVTFAVSSMFFHEYTTEEIFSFVERSGLTGIEYWMETPHFWLRDMPVHEVVECHKRHKALSTITVHAPILDLNPCSINPDVAEISIDYAVNAVEFARQLNAPVLTLHPGRRTAKRPVGAADFTRFDAYLSALRAAAMKNSIKISMENMEPAVNSLICTPERMREVLDQEPWLSFTLDTSHALSKSVDEPARYIELCGDRLANVHLSRVEGKVQHLPLDESPVMAGVMEALGIIGYRGSITLEIDDLNLPNPLSSDEKIAILSRDCAFMHACLG